MNRTILFALLTAALATPAFGDDEVMARPAADAGAPAGEAATDDKVSDSALMNSSKLRDRVRGMRKQVLGGGPAVEKSESEAMRFYRGKIHDIARQADELRTQRDSKDAEYRVALDTTLTSEDPDERAEAAREAQGLRRQISALDSETQMLEKRGESLGRGVESIQRRIDKRKRLLSTFDRGEVVDDLPYLEDEVLGGEEDEGGGASNPFGDDEFIADLLKRDPTAARRLIFEADPRNYFARFPLKPSQKSLRKALPFPPPDMPGNR